MQLNYNLVRTKNSPKISVNISSRNGHRIAGISNCESSYRQNVDSDESMPVFEGWKFG